MTVFTTNTAHGASSHHGLIDAARRCSLQVSAQGYRAYLTYTRLDAMSDRELAERGLTRRISPASQRRGILNAR